MTDQLDFASELQDELNAQGVAKSRDALLPQRHALFNGADCLDCGEEIPAGRLAMGRMRCVKCQTKKEKK